MPPHIASAGDPAIFPVLDHVIHLDHAAVAPLPGPTADAMRKYLDEWSTGAPRPWGYQSISRVRELGARMLGAPAGAVCYIPNTSTGIAIVARGLELGPGDVVVTNSIEFPANRYTWQELARDGVHVITVDPRGDFLLDPEDLATVVREHFPAAGTAVLAVSHVQYSTGQRLDIERLAAVAHEAGGLICVDGIQAVGQMPMAVEAWGIDFLSADGHKWMLGPEGAGIFYCRPDLIERLRPPVIGWLSVRNPFDFDEPELRLRDDARRFEPGCFNVAGAVGLATSLDLLLDAGLAAVRDAIGELAGRLAEGAAGLGCRIVSPRDEWGTGIVALAPPAGGPGPDQVAEGLAARGVVGASRRGVVRLAPHFYNTTEQIDATLAALKAAL